MAKMTKMMESIQRELREIRESTGTSQHPSVATRTPAEDEELRVLRAENEAMKQVLRTLPPQTQFETPRYSQGLDDGFGTPESSSANAFDQQREDDDLANDTLYFEDDDMCGGYDDFNEPMTETSGLVNLERDATQGYSIWRGDGGGSDGADFDDDEDPAIGEPEPEPGSGPDDHVHSDPATGERCSARSRERRQTLPADFIAEEQRYLLSDSNDENFDPDDPKVKGRKHKRTRSAERRRRERLERQQDSLWKKGVPGGGYENGDGWVEQRRHHSGRFGRKAAVSGGLAVYPKYVNDKLFANGRQIPTTHKRLARELVYLGLDDWIDKDKSDALYRRTIRVARKHYAFHHGGISSKALCQGKYTRKELEQVGMWDDELYEEINMGEESDVEKLDFPLDPALQDSIQRWKKEGAQAKERRRRAAQAAAEASGEGGDDTIDFDPTSKLISEVPQIADELQPLDNNNIGMTEFSDDGGVQANLQPNIPQVADRVERHTKFDAIWQAPVPTSDNSVLSIIHHAEARIKAAEEEMGEPTFKSKKAQKFKTIPQLPKGSTDPLARTSSDILLSHTSTSNKNPKSKKAAPVRGAGPIQSEKPAPMGANISLEELDRLKPGTVRTMAENLELLDLAEKEEKSFLREVRAYFAVDKDTGAQLSAQEHISLTDEQLQEYAVHFLETNIVMVGGSKKIGFAFWPDDGSRQLNYAANRTDITQRVYDIFGVMRYNKARYLRKTQGEKFSMSASRSSNGKSCKTSTSSKPQVVQSSPLLRAFDNGLRYKVPSANFRGNGYYYADGAPRTAEDAARLKRKYEQKLKGKGGRASLQVISLSDNLSDGQVLEQEPAQRRATMGDVDPVREASVLGDSVTQMASAMKKLTQAFEDTSEQIEVDATSDDDDLDEDDLDDDHLDEDDLINDGLDDAQSMAIVHEATQISEASVPGLGAPQQSRVTATLSQSQIARVYPPTFPLTFNPPAPNNGPPFTNGISSSFVRRKMPFQRFTAPTPLMNRQNLPLELHARSVVDASTAEAITDGRTAETDHEVTHFVIQTKDVGYDTVPTSTSQASGGEDTSSMLVSNALPADTTATALQRDVGQRSLIKATAIPPLTTRSSARAASRRCSTGLGTAAVKPKQPVVEVKSRAHPPSPSEKENATPIPELSVSSDTEPPAKKLKTTIVKRGPRRLPRKSAAESHQSAKETMEREKPLLKRSTPLRKSAPPRKSAAELDQLAKETMERETRSAAWRSRVGLQFESSFRTL